MNEIKYPARYDLQQAFKEFCQYKWLEKFAQEQGILLSNATHDGLADFLSGLFFEHAQLERIRNSALQTASTNSVYGFRVATDDSNFSLPDMIDNYREKVVDQHNQMKVKALVYYVIENSKLFHGTIEYLQQKPGRIQFLQGTERAFDYYIRLIADDEWEIMVDCGRSIDGRLIEEWVSKKLPRDSYVMKIEQDRLTTSQTIRFFDELGSEGAGMGWRLSQVKRIVLRRDNGSSDVEEEHVETSESVLSGITQAILEGSELRNNPFVKQCEEGGYRFMAMTYEYESKEQPFVKEIRAEFKQRPKVFEISLPNYYRRSGINGSLEKQGLSSEHRVQILSVFWGKAKGVFDKLTNENIPF